jgi:AdoMet-dependent heme synthase
MSRTCRTPLPQSLVWEVTPRCNLCCAHCYNVWTAPHAALPGELDTSVMVQLLQRLEPHARRLRSFTLSGGEPLLRSDLELLITRTRQTLPSAQINVSTNGYELTSARSRALMNAGANAIQLTLLSADPEVHNEMVGRQGAFQQVLSALACAREAGLKVAIFFVATRRNIHTWPGAARLALALGVNALVFNRFQPGGRALSAWETLTPTSAQLAGALQQIHELRRLADIQLGTPIPPCEWKASGLSARRRRIMACPIGTKHAYPTIGPDGNLRPCNHSPKISGNLLDTPLEALLHRVPEECLPAECKDCADKTACQGGCPEARRLAGAPIYCR